MQGNFIGTNAEGTADLGNAFLGVLIDSTSNYNGDADLIGMQHQLAVIADLPGPVAQPRVLVGVLDVGVGTVDRLQSVGAGGGHDEETLAWPELSLEALAAALTAGETTSRWRLACGGWAVWDYAEAAVEICL